MLRYLLMPVLLAAALIGGACSKIKDDRPNVAQVGGGVAQLDAELGLPDARIGAPLSSFDGLETVEEVGAWGTYRRPADRSKYKRWPVEEIIYNFYQGRLYSIRIELLDVRSVRAILIDFYEQYGPEDHLQRKRFGDYDTTLVIREWDGEKVDLVYKYADDFSGGTIIWVDSTAWNQLNEGRQAVNAELREAMSGSMLNLDFD